MSDLPPPTGTPVAFALYGDPWAEQERRHAMHLAERRARRRRRLLYFALPAAVLLVGAGVVTTILVANDDPDTPVVASAATIAPAAATTPTADQLIPTADAASVDEVWLLDRGNGSYDWGAIVSSASDVARSDLAVTVTLFDADDLEVFVDEVVIAQLVPDGQSVIGGVLEVDTAMPARIDVTATLGSAAPDAVVTTIGVSDLRRINSGQIDRDDRLLGTIDIINGDTRAVNIAMLWRDQAGQVVASVFDVIDVVDPSQPTDFSLRLPRAAVPAREPDEIVATAVALN